VIATEVALDYPIHKPATVCRRTPTVAGASLRARENDSVERKRVILLIRHRPGILGPAVVNFNN
jgi:hypothetical protein